MPTVAEVTRRLLPEGSRKGAARWNRCPIWPPDVFAVAATLVNLSGCYTKPRFSAAFNKNYAFKADYRKRVAKLGDSWMIKGEVPAGVQELWSNLVELWGLWDISGTSPFSDAWQEEAMNLMAIADHASSGVGFAAEYDAPFPWLVRIEHWLELRSRRGEPLPFPRVLPHIPGSICQLVPPQEVTVLPKSLTAQVGCTMRSLSHNLALLPPEGVVASSWLLGESRRSPESGDNRTMNVLLIPFPYRVRGACFEANRQGPGASVRQHRHHSFTLRQLWLEEGGWMTAEEFADELIIPLVESARMEVRNVHAIVLPEAALNEDIASGLARILAKKSDIELLITGVMAHGPSGFAENRAVAYCFDRDRILTPWEQKKGHRWALEQRQIEQYHLGHVFEPKRCTWWEQIDVQGRKCVFYAMTGGATLSVMICEDLARFDPIHPVVRAVGPNLLVALLMDGPQLRNRWSGRYATVLADDPGTAVLTLTSIGMVRRSSMPGVGDPRQVGLWKQPGGDAQELILPPGDHALVLTLSLHHAEQMTLDGRTDFGVTRRFELSGVRPVRIEKSEARQRYRLE